MVRRRQKLSYRPAKLKIIKNSPKKASKKQKEKKKNLNVWVPSSAKILAFFFNFAPLLVIA